MLQQCHSVAFPSQNPMYASFEFGVGDFYFASNATVNVLNDLNDPRLSAFYSPATTGTFKDQIRGINQGTIDNEPFTAPSSDYSGSSAIAYGPANSVILMSDWRFGSLEQKQLPDTVPLTMMLLHLPMPLNTTSATWV